MISFPENDDPGLTQTLVEAPRGGSYIHRDDDSDEDNDNESKFGEFYTIPIPRSVCLNGPCVNLCCIFLFCVRR